MPDPKNIKEILRSHGLAPNKNLGQNFLTNPAIASRIVTEAGITKKDTVLELGVGLATLTLPLAALAGKVIGLEIDQGIINWHKEASILPDNVELVHQDLLLADFENLAKTHRCKLKILANLPYSVSSPLLFKLLDNAAYIDFAVLMLQKEMAARLTARKGTKEYGILTVLFAPYATVQKLFLVGPGNFHPRPKVDSTVVRMTFHSPPESLKNFSTAEKFRHLVRAAFQQRRKTLINSLAGSSLFPEGKGQIRLLLEGIGIDPRSRAENLEYEEYMLLAEQIQPPTSF
jgi:16S rRNA (adenine1518-N6/adenine1519-N6)-dimethyltransferase